MGLVVSIGKSILQPRLLSVVTDGCSGKCSFIGLILLLPSFYCLLSYPVLCHLLYLSAHIAASCSEWELSLSLSLISPTFFVLSLPRAFWTCSVFFIPVSYSLSSEDSYYKFIPVVGYFWHMLTSSICPAYVTSWTWWRECCQGNGQSSKSNSLLEWAHPSVVPSCFVLFLSLSASNYPSPSLPTSLSPLSAFTCNQLHKSNVNVWTLFKSNVQYGLVWCRCMEMVYGQFTKVTELLFQQLLTPSFSKVIFQDTL